MSAATIGDSGQRNQADVTSLKTGQESVGNFWADGWP
jgi:hypothetical protein